MGVCCGKDAMPVVDDQPPPVVADNADNSPPPRRGGAQSPQNQRSRHGAVMSGDAVAFNLVVPKEDIEDDDLAHTVAGTASTGATRQPSFLGRYGTSSPQGGGLLGGSFVGQSAATPRDFDAATVNSRASVGDPLSASALSFLTNGNQDVSYDYVFQFISRMRDGGGDPLEGSVGRGGGDAGSVSGGTNVSGTSRGALGISREQWQHIRSAPSAALQVERLVAAEEASRIDLLAAYRMNAMLFQLASQRMVPTVRQRRQTVTRMGVPPSSSVAEVHTNNKTGNNNKTTHSRTYSTDKGRSKSKSGSKRGNNNSQGADAAGKPPVVLVIHAKDVQLSFDDPPMGEDDDNRSAFHPTSDAPPPAAHAAHRDPNNTSNHSFSPRSPAPGHESNSGSQTSPPQTTPVAAATNNNNTHHNSHPQSAAKEHVVQQYEMLALSAREVSVTGDVKGMLSNDTWDFLSLPTAQKHLNAGGSIFRFKSKPVPQLDDSDLEMYNMFINESGFKDESVENNVPIVNVYDKPTQQKYVAIMVKAMYMLPGVRLATLTKDLLASLDYQRSCQPGDVKFVDENIGPLTFRQTKTIIKFIFSITIQLRVHEITDPEKLLQFKDCDGMIPAKALVLERTKKNIQNVDSTAKCKSLLLYYPVNDGVLVTNVTCILNTSVPKVVSKLLDTFGSQGSKEAAETAMLTRRYMIHRFGDSREGLS